MLFRSYEAFKSIQEKNYKQMRDTAEQTGKSSFEVHLGKAAANFTQGRNHIRAASEIAKVLKWGPVREEALCITRIIVVNSIALHKLAKSYDKTSQNVENMSLREVRFDFGTHPHFPIFQIDPQR